MSLFIFFISFKASAITILDINFAEDLPPGVESKSPEALDAISVATNAGRDGGAAAKIKVMNSSVYHSDGKVRAEYNTLGNKMTSYHDGDEFTYQFSFKLDSTWIFDNRASEDIIWQFKRTEGQPDMFVAVKGSDLVLRIGEDRQLLLASSLQKGIWSDVKLHINFSKSESGQVQAFFKYSSDEEYQIHSDTGPNFRKREGGLTYLKWGIYKPDCTETILTSEQAHILFLDQISVTKP